MKTNSKNNNNIVLQKYMADCGVGSRRKCADLISQNKVIVNGRIASLGTRVSRNDIILVNNKKIIISNQSKIYIMINKPRGYVTSLHDEYNRKCISDLVKDINSRIYPVGRLDKDSEGLLLMTNDGNFANCVIHPSKNISKTYKVVVKSNVTENELLNLRNITKIDNKTIEPAKVKIIEFGQNRTVLEISIKQGLNRQIRKMCEKVGLEISRLKRISIGNLKLENLAPGKYRNLENFEVNYFID